MPSNSVSGVQFRSPDPEPDATVDLPSPGSAANWGSKRYTAWATRRGRSPVPEPGMRTNIGSLRDFGEDD